MRGARHGSQHGQAIVLVALVLTVLFGFVGLAIDGGRGYLDRRHLQGSVDAAALAAAYDYMNNTDYGSAELAAVNEFAENERLYGSPTCSGYGTMTVSCLYSDPTNQALTLNVANHSIAGVTFQATAVHHVGITIMQVMGFGPTVTVGAQATAVARRQGTNGAAIQTLSQGSCNATGPSLVFTGTSATPPPNQGWMYITEPNPPSTIEPLSPSLQNAPGGQLWAAASGSCSATNPAHDRAPLQVTIRYNFVPFTPLIQQVMANRIVISAAATYKTEY